MKIHYLLANNDLETVAVNFEYCSAIQIQISNIAVQFKVRFLVVPIRFCSRFLTIENLHLHGGYFFQKIFL